LRDVSSVVASIHHSSLDLMVLDKLLITWLFHEPKVVDIRVVDRLLGLLGGRVMVVIVVVSDCRQDHCLGEVFFEHTS